MSERDAVGDGATCSCKVGRAVAAYDLGDLDADVRRRRAEGASLRDLERFVNQSVLRGALDDASSDVIGDVEAIYKRLTGDDVSAGERTEVRDRLAHAGVDVDAVDDAFVSYQTVRTHLQECLDVDTRREGSVSVDEARGTIEWARSRSEGIVDRTLQRLAAADEVTAGDLDVSHVIRVTCADCGARETVGAFVDDGGCDCPPD